jgi:hypothetical protein
MNAQITWLLVPVFAITVGGCSKHYIVPSPPLPATCSSNEDMDGIRFSFNKWKGGLAIMFVDSVNGSVIANGSLNGSTYTGHVSVRRADGDGYDWRLVTKDGRTAELAINDVSYDLTKGT